MLISIFSMSSLLKTFKSHFDTEITESCSASLSKNEEWVIVELQKTRLKCEPAENLQGITDLRTSLEGQLRFEDGKELYCTRADIKFRYVDHLYYGSFGDVVTRAVYTPTNKGIAVKIIRIFDRLSGRNDGRSMKDILRKMEIAALMRHANVVRMHGFVIEEMTCYMVMEPMQASLSEVIRIVHSNKISKTDVYELENCMGSMTVDIVSALAFLSELKINAVLSPKRVLMGEDGTVKICSSAAFETGGATPVRYSAPELLESSADTDYRKTCVWSLAILLIEAATGKYPYPGSIDFVISDQILDGKIQPRLGNEFSHRLRNFVDACLFHSTQSRASPTVADANCLQNKRFYRLHAQRENRQESVRTILQRVQPHLEEMRREK